VIADREGEGGSQLGGSYRGKEWEERKGRGGERGKRKEEDDLAPQTRFLDPPLVVRAITLSNVRPPTLTI
jgi:hypothetical protein